MGHAYRSQPWLDADLALALAHCVLGRGGYAHPDLPWLKARLILGNYLGLDAAPFWRRGFETSLALFCLLLLGLDLTPALL